jgi:hypothetical protein
LDHLVCNICQKDFSEDPGSVCEGIDGFAYCQTCWKVRFCPTCGTCKEPIVGQTLNAGTKSYHPDGCFICSVCKAPLDGKFFASTTGDLLCEHHYFMENGRICGGENSGGCGKPIIAGKIITTKAEGILFRFFLTNSHILTPGENSEFISFEHLISTIRKTKLNSLFHLGLLKVSCYLR